MIRFKTCIIAACAAGTACAIAMSGTGFAEGDDAAPQGKEKQKKTQKEIVVTATKTSIDPRETGASITIITEKEMEQKGKRTVASALRDVPGLNVVATSPFGGVTEVYLRGANSGNSIVLIDGIRITDPSSIARDYDFAHLMTDNIERIEVIRGTQSTLYGSDAMGGVINIITKKGKGDPVFNLWAEGGSYATFKEFAGVNGGTDKAYYSFSISRTDSQGFNKTSGGANFTSDDDGYNNTTITTNLGFKGFHNSLLGISLRYINAHVEIDDAAAEDDPNNRTDTENLAWNIHYTIPVFSWWESSLYFSYSSIVRQYRDPKDEVDTGEDDDSTYKGRLMKGEWRNRFTVGDIDEILIGGEFEKEFADTHASIPAWFVLSSSNENSTSGALYAQNHLKLFDRVFFITGIRYTSTEYYSDKVDYTISASVIVPFSETRIKGNVGSGFKTPSLYQRFDPTYGNANLDSERSTSYDIGFEQPFFEEMIVVGATYFFIQFSDMIAFNNSLPPFGRYDNISEVESQGAECFVRIAPIEELLVVANYTYTWAINTDTDKLLLRRPEHTATINVNYIFLEKGNFNIGLNWVGERVDGSKREKLSPYWRLDAALSFWVLDELQVFARGENLLNQEYEEINGYNTPGMSFYGGLRARL